MAVLLCVQYMNHAKVISGDAYLKHSTYTCMQFTFDIISPHPDYYSPLYTVIINSWPIQKLKKITYFALMWDN
jgi:hypothetical protein